MNNNQYVIITSTTTDLVEIVKSLCDHSKLDVLTRLFQSLHANNSGYAAICFEILTTMLTEAAKAPDAKDEKKEAPWYPDDSGEWVEVSSYVEDYEDIGLQRDDEVEILTNRERKLKEFTSSNERVVSWEWALDTTDSNRIVAYKLIKKG